MRLELTGRQIAITPVVRKAVEGRLGRVARLLSDDIVSVQVVITREQSRIRVDMTLHVRGEHFFHGEGTGPDLTAALGAATEKVEHQARKLKSKWAGRKRQGVSAVKAGPAASRPEPARRTAGTAGGVTAAGPVRIVRARRYAVNPMSVEEAALDVGAGRDAFLVFRNIATDAISVLFRRPDGNLGVIEPEA